MFCNYLPDSHSFLQILRFRVNKRYRQTQGRTHLYNQHAPQFSVHMYYMYISIHVYLISVCNIIWITNIYICTLYYNNTIYIFIYTKILCWERFMFCKFFRGQSMTSSEVILSLLSMIYDILWYYEISFSFCLCKAFDIRLCYNKINQCTSLSSYLFLVFQENIN